MTPGATANLGHILEARDMTVAELQRQIGEGSERHLGDLVAGRVSRPRRSTLLKIAAALGVTLDELRGDAPTLENFVVGMTLADADVLRAVGLIERRSDQETLQRVLHQWARDRRELDPGVAAIVDAAAQARIERVRNELDGDEPGASSHR